MTTSLAEQAMQDGLEVAALAQVPTEAELTARTLRGIFGIPDVDDIDLAAMTPQAKATLRHDLARRAGNVRAAIEELLSPISALSAQCDADIFTAIKESGGTKLFHPDLNIELVTPKRDKDKRIDVLRRLKDYLPAQDYANAVFRKQVVIKAALDDETIAKVQEIVGPAEIVAPWDADGNVLNNIAKAAGPESEVGKIIAEGYRKPDDIVPRLVIEERAK